MSSRPHRRRRLFPWWPRKRRPVGSAEAKVPPRKRPAVVPPASRWSVEQTQESLTLRLSPPITRVQIYPDGVGRWPR